MSKSIKQQIYILNSICYIAKSEKISLIQSGIIFKKHASNIGNDRLIALINRVVKSILLIDDIISIAIIYNKTFSEIYFLLKKSAIKDKNKEMARLINFVKTITVYTK